MYTNLEVRDYECDLQGIVNNAVYMNYLEHARHDWLRSNSIDFKAMHEAGIDLVLYRYEIDYKQSLGPGDKFKVHTEASKESKLKFTFKQKIYKEEELMLSAVAFGTCVDRKLNKPCVCAEMDAALC